MKSELNLLMYTVILLLGSNLGNRVQHFADAEALLAHDIGIIKKSSSVYETAAWGFTDQPAFLNKVLLIETDFTPHEVLEKILSIESKLGRTRTEKWHERSIDIDILFYNNLVLDAEDLKIPHPHLHQRRFTLEPLNEIASYFIHPIFNKNIQHLLNNCEDSLQVKKFEP